MRTSKRKVRSVGANRTVSGVYVISSSNNRVTADGNNRVTATGTDNRVTAGG